MHWLRPMPHTFVQYNNPFLQTLKLNILVDLHFVCQSAPSSHSLRFHHQMSVTCRNKQGLKDIRGSNVRSCRYIDWRKPSEIEEPNNVTELTQVQ